MLARIALAVIALSSLFAADSSKKIPIEITHENGAFKGQFAVSMTGTLDKAKTEWNGSIKNTSDHKLFRAEFCVRAFDESGAQIKPGGEDCIINLWGWNWAQGVSLNFKGKRDVKVSEEKAPIAISKFTVTAKDVFDTAPNVRTLTTACALVWPASIRTFADRKFRPTVMDKESLTATYAYEGGRIDGYTNSREMLKSYTTASTAFFGPSWDSFRIDSASIYLREEKVGECTAEIKMSFAGFAEQWYVVESNFNFEKALLDEIGTQSKQAAKTDMDKAIRQLPNEEPKVAGVVQPQLTITSQPDGADIAINGEFVGNTPTTIMTVEGKVTIKVTKSGFQPWERTLSLVAGDKRTLVVEMSR
jgi:hypothetical protein